MSPQVSANAEIQAIEIEAAQLRPLAVDDAEDLFEVFRDPEAMRCFGTPHGDAAETRRMLRDLDLEQGGGKWHRMWAILPAGEARCRGWVGLMNRIPDQDNCELSFILKRDWWGRGITTSAARAALAYAFDIWGIHRVYAVVTPENAASLCIVEKLGFELEGRQRESFRSGDRYHDDLLYGLLARDFVRGVEA